DLQSLTINGDACRFVIGDADSALTVHAKIAASVLHGTVRAKDVIGDLDLFQLADLSHDYLDTLAGDYELPGGELLVFAREHIYLCYLDHRTGRTGRMMPEDATRFWAGPSLEVRYPKMVRFQFFKDATGKVTGVEMAEEGRAKVRGRRAQHYREGEVHFPNGAVVLAGSLKLPQMTKPCAAVVLLAGSNYQPRGGQNGLVGFVGDQFARHGFVVLAYDKRGTGKSGGERDDNYDLLSGDGASAVGWLRGRREGDPERIGVWGIREGGGLAPIVAQKAGNIAFLINVSGSIINSNEQEIQRKELTLRADGFSEKDIADAVHLQQLKFRYACQRDNWNEYQE